MQLTDFPRIECDPLEREGFTCFSCLQLVISLKQTSVSVKDNGKDNVIDNVKDNGSFIDNGRENG